MDVAPILTDSVTVQSQTASTNGGAPTWGSQRPLPAKVNRKERRFVNANGVTVQASHQILLSQALAIGDRLWLPEGDITKPAQAKRVLDVGSGSDAAGLDTLYVASVG